MLEVITNAIAHCILIFGFNVGCNDNLEGIDFALSITISLAILAGIRIEGKNKWMTVMQNASPLIRFW